MTDRIQCPICGKMIDTTECEYLDNGSPACPDCAQQEREYEEQNN